MSKPARHADRRGAMGRSPGFGAFLVAGWVFVLLVSGCVEDREGGDGGAGVATSGEASIGQPEPPPIVDPGDTVETTRLWSEPVKAQLAVIAEALGAGERSPAVAAAVFGEAVEAPDFERWAASEVFRDPVLTVAELAPPDGAAGDEVAKIAPDEFLGRLRRLLVLGEGGPGTAAKFKLFGIVRVGDEGGGSRLATRQRLTARGSRDGSGHEVRSTAVVDAVWEIPGGAGSGTAADPAAGPPRLVRFSMPKVVRAERIAGDDRRFRDVAGRVLGGNAAWSDQLQVGMNRWSRRIERSLDPDFLGYHGVAVGDVDGDGLEDVHLCQPGGLPNLLFRRLADGTFLDVSAEAGVDWLDNSTAALLVDLDNDGDKDLAVATRAAFLVMENDGSGRFALRERITDAANGYSPTAADYDLDGDLDLLVLKYAGDGEVGDFPTPHPFHDARNGGANLLLRNEGGFAFTDATDQAGLGIDNHRFSFAASWEDYDDDGDPDLYIANDFGPNQLLRNDGGSFTDQSDRSGARDWGFGMSATWGDYDRDGDMDLYVSSMFSGAGNQLVAQSDFNPRMPAETRARYLKMVRGNSLLRNLGGGRFTDVTDPMAEGFAEWAWGAVFADLNHDTWEDLYVANGYLSQPDTEDL